jgi:hypothetical protein
VYPAGPNAVKTLLNARLSTLAKSVLFSEDSASRAKSDLGLKNAVFHPKSLNLQYLIKLGSLNIKWTEYLDEHLRFDDELMTLYVYWFASHLHYNRAYQSVFKALL